MKLKNKHFFIGKFSHSMKKWIKRTIIGILSIILVGFLIPQNLKMPVADADSNEYTPDIR